MFIDTHCHLSHEDYDDIDLVMQENSEAGVKKIIISGCSKSWIEESLKLSSEYSNIYVTLGYHPSEANDVTDEMLDEKINFLFSTIKGETPVTETEKNPFAQSITAALYFLLVRYFSDETNDISIRNSITFIDGFISSCL